MNDISHNNPVPCIYKHQGLASRLPARKLPIITVDAPRVRAFTICPEFEIPPSAITGTP